MAAGIFSLPRVNRANDGWSNRSLRSMLVARSERNRADLPLLTVARERGVFVRSDDDANHNTIPEDLSNYKIAHAGDLVINKMKAWQGSLGLAPEDGIVSPAYFVFATDFAVPRFGEYLLRSKPYVAKFGAASDGVRIGQWDLNIPRMRNIEVKLPPQEGQAAIVKYLAHANARIDKAISAKRRLVALLEEQRDHQSRELLANALERSLEQTDSGYGWIGQVPSSWRKFRLKALATLLRTRPYIDMFRSLSTGIRPSRLRFYPDQMLATPVFLPPLSEQKQIIASIESSAMRAQAPIEKVQREIALLREFWTRLVADVVTGQVDVRAIAATLPEAPEAVADHAASSGDEFADLQEEDL